MRISGVTILNNALSLGYPFRESIGSLLPLVDELIVNVGQGDDGTWEAVRALADPKIKAFRSVWDLTPRDGQSLSEQTNLALVRCRGDWTLYLQADEALHEDDRGPLREQIERHTETSVEGLVFDYLHFYASPHVINDDWLSFYPLAVRAIRNGLGIVSAGDAAGFVRQIGARSRGLLKARAEARVFHYGWADQGKHGRSEALSAFYHSEFSLSPKQMFPTELSQVPQLRLFEGTHPAPMRVLVERAPRPRLGRPHATPARARAWWRFLTAPRLHADSVRPLLPLWLTNLRWRVLDFWS